MRVQTLPHRPTTHPLPGWGLWAAWIIATTYGTVASLLLFVIMPGSSALIEITPQVGIVAIIMSIAQWPVLYRYLPKLSLRQWLGANVLGYLVGLFAAWACLSLAAFALAPYGDLDVIKRPITDFILGAATGTGAGTILALLQWQALRLHLPGKGIWIGANIAAWMLLATGVFILQWLNLTYGINGLVAKGQAPSEVLSRLSGLPLELANVVIFGSISGLLIGAITGTALAALVRARVRETA